MYDWLLFDLDGTLSNTEEGVTKSFQYALVSMGVKCEDREPLKKYIGPPLMESFSEYFDHDGCLRAVGFFRERYETKGIKECELFPGIAEMLAAAKKSGKMTAVATSKPEKFAKKVLEDFGIDKYIDVLSGALDDSSTKTDVVNTALKRAGIENDRGRAIMIGDRKYDVEGAAACGIDTLGVYYGFAEPGELERAGAKYVLDTVDELTGFVRAKSLAEIEKYLAKEN
ncbi:MAG: HAD hydrolase-like protein [Lachnospiraceae bacterium]|nr:HAD hydrolase-like protein [Lachnospiraceae bacterium]